jgi:hypothetical protein
MQVSRLNASLLVFLLTFFSITIIARAADDDNEPDDYDVKDRVVRISLITGEVSLKRKGNQDWERARINYPLVEGDTIATDKDSRMEIQVDARNFVRLAPATALRIVTLRDEGVALSVLEGTAVLRLVKFDRSREYFEIDAPKTTMAAEKPGLYRVDVPRDGRVRLTVRDGGSARIYSDTSGFALRDGRSAELVVTGENAGDWEFLAAASRDVVDDWVDDRERYLAQRLRYDVEYYDEYVWGAEDLAAYGEWTYTNDFGWIWRPHPSTISAYGDWAPYRYGHWVWCPPYGWTWVGNEPWGWAPYHYGRWVYHNNAWAWVPRSKYNRHRSWWRPALVAFVSLNFSFGNDICWYPLSYYQHDPHSRHYRHQYRPPSRPGGGGGGYGGGGNGGGGGGGRPQPPVQAGDYKSWRGVTRVPRRDFGNENERGRPADERIARRVFESAPAIDELPRRTEVSTGNAPRPVQVSDTPTGAAERTPGVALDEDLRRSRIFRGREPREPRVPIAPGQNTQTTEPAISDSPRRTTTPPDASERTPGGRRPTETTTQPALETPPSGAVARPEPQSEDRPGRMVRPTTPDGGEKRGRGQQGIENDPPRETERPRIETRSEPRISAPPRSESPRSEPPRSEPPPPRSESPRSEPPPRVESPRSEPPRSESPRSESPRSESPRSEPPPRSESPRSESPRSDPPPRSEPAPRSESPRPEPRSESPRSEGEPSRPKKPDDPTQ